MSDIVERLRSMSGRDFWPPEADRLCAEAGAEIERLRARNAELRRLLLDCRGYVSDAGNDEDPETQRLSADLCAAIDAALAQAEGT